GALNTRFGNTVLPLPAHGVRTDDRPPTRLQDDPVYRRFPQDWQRYHTRYVGRREKAGVGYAAAVRGRRTTPARSADARAVNSSRSATPPGASGDPPGGAGGRDPGRWPGGGRRS